MLAIDVFPCEDGHAQERSLLKDVLVQRGENNPPAKGGLKP
ncbi:MAG: hypothetical protein AB4426_34360 [Xenococcaceae cyanobacterium]